MYFLKPRNSLFLKPFKIPHKSHNWLNQWPSMSNHHVYYTTLTSTFYLSFLKDYLSLSLNPNLLALYFKNIFSAHNASQASTSAAVPNSTRRSCRRLMNNVLSIVSAWRRRFISLLYVHAIRLLLAYRRGRGISSDKRKETSVLVGGFI